MSLFLFIGPVEARELMTLSSTGDSKGTTVCVAVSFWSNTHRGCLFLHTINVIFQNEGTEEG